MVCDRCIMVVRQELDKMAIPYKQVQLGLAELSIKPPADRLAQFSTNIQQLGFELLDDKKSRIVEKIKTAIVELIHGNNADGLNIKLSVLLEEKLQLDYHYLSTLFSSVEGVTIERYAILQRIEKVKELLVYNEMSLSDIAFEMGYSSVQHLSLQFKKITGLTPSQFRQMKQHNRKPLDKV